MIDIHSHFLYGLDDGAKDLDMSLAMLKQAEQVGIKRMLATPHANEHTSGDTESRIKTRFDELKKIIIEKGISLKIELAAEISYNADLLRWIDKSWALIGTNQRYMFFELPLQGIPVDVTHTIFQLGLKKIIPVLAHPERIIDIQEDPDRLIKWIHQGIIVQMNAGSIIGQFGKKHQSFSEALLKAHAVHCVASDAHDDKSRNYKILAGAFDWIEKNISKEYAKILFHDNPERLLEGEEIIKFEVREEKLKRSFLEDIKRKFKFWE